MYRSFLYPYVTSFYLLVIITHDVTLQFCSTQPQPSLVCVVFLDVREVFDLFDFWDGRDGLVDGAKVGDLLRCCSLNPTNKLVFDNGGTKKLGNDRQRAVLAPAWLHYCKTFVCSRPELEKNKKEARLRRNPSRLPG